MAPPTKTLFVEGNFADLAIQLADFLDSIVKDGNVRAEVEPLVEKPEEALQKLVDAAGALNSAPEKGTFIVMWIFAIIITDYKGSDCIDTRMPAWCRNLLPPSFSSTIPSLSS